MHRLLYISGAVAAAAILFLIIPALFLSPDADQSTVQESATTTIEAAPDPLAPLRDIPESFPPNTYRPKIRESKASGSIDLGSFSPGRELTYIDDPRVWWESDNDTNDTEDDHTIHKAMALPLKRLIEMVAARGATLKVQDTYRPSGIHSSKSLHKEGRAIDLTCDELGLEKLARLCWAAGFDWVFHEARARGGAHVHCSVKSSP